jgi:hypothetical protein
VFEVFDRNLFPLKPSSLTGMVSYMVVYTIDGRQRIEKRTNCDWSCLV